MATVGSLNVLLSANSDKFGRDLKKAQGSVSLFSQMTKGIGAGGLAALAGGFMAAQVAMKGFAAVGNAVMGVLEGVGSFIVESIKVGAQFEAMEVSMGAMLGSAAKGAALMQDIKKFAKTTPFEISDITSSTNQLLGFGFAQQELMPTMKLLGDLAAGTNQPISHMAYLFGSARVEGRALTKDIRQWLTAGVGILKPLAQQFGVTEQEIFKLAESGKIHFSDLQAALQSLTAEGGVFHNQMHSRMGTVAGAFANLSDVVTVMKAEIGRAFSDSVDLTQLVQGMVRFGEALTAAVIPRVKALGAAIGQLDFKAIGHSILMFGVVAIKAFAHIVDAISHFIGKGIALMAQFVSAAHEMHKLGAKMKIPGMEDLAFVSGVIKNNMITVANSLTGLDSSGAADAFVKDLMGALATGGGAKGGGAMGMGLGGAISQAFAGITPQMLESANKAKAIGAAWGEKFSSGFTAVMTGAKGLGGKAMNFFDQLKTGLVDGIDKKLAEVRQIHDARFAGFGNASDAFGASAREAHNIRFRRDQEQTKEEKKQTDMLRQIRDFLKGSDVLIASDVS
jgi:tape measure domain-containing protein